MAQLPKCGLVRGRDKPIHGSCAIYFPGGRKGFVTFDLPGKIRKVRAIKKIDTTDLSHREIAHEVLFPPLRSRNPIKTFHILWGTVPYPIPDGIFENDDFSFSLYKGGICDSFHGRVSFFDWQLEKQI